MRRSGIHRKQHGVIVAAPPVDPSPNVVTVGADMRTSALRPSLALVGNSTLFNTTAKATMAASCMDVIVHAISFAQRTDLWPTQATPTSSWNWGGLDARINAINAAGLRAYVMLGMPPPWMFPAGTDINTKFFPNANLSDAVTFATALATRYVPGGAFGDGVYGFCSHNELKGLFDTGLGRDRWEDFTVIYNAMYSAIKGVSASIKVGGAYINEPRIQPGATGYVSDPSSSLYISSGTNSSGQIVTIDSRKLQFFQYWYANKTGADFVCQDGNYRYTDNTVNWYRTINSVTEPILWTEFYAAALPDTYYSATPTTKEKTLRLIHNMLIAAYAGASSICVWGGDTGSAGPYPENGLWDHTTGLATDTGTLMQLLKDNFSQSQDGSTGVDLKQFNSNNPGIVGIASATKVLIINKTGTSQLTDTPGGTITLDPKAWVLQ